MQLDHRLGRFVVALVLIGFGVQNLLFGRAHIVARIAPWPPDDQSAQMVGAGGALVFLGGVAMLMGRGVRLAGLAWPSSSWHTWLHLGSVYAGPA